MKKLSLIWLLLTAFSASYAQVDNPVHWKCWRKKIADKSYELHFTATIDQPYHIYAQKNEKDIALPTKINFSANPRMTLKDSVAEVGKLETRKEKLTGEMINYYADKVDFVQVIKIKPGGGLRVKGYIDYMACTNEHCLPEAKQVFDISINLKQ